MQMVDLVVVGAGPAGRALARSATIAGGRVGLIDPEPDRRWTQTFGAWADELPAGMPSDTVAASMIDIEAIGTQRHRLGRTYRILDTGVLQDRLSLPRPTVVVRDTVVTVEEQADGALVHTPSTTVAADVVVDATGGARAVLDGQGTAASTRTAQTAFGVVVDEPFDFQPVFMDWRPDHGEEGWPTFLYAVRLGGGKVLLEETALARRPPLPISVLHRRLMARLAGAGIEVPPTAPREVVDIAVDLPASRGHGRVVPFGAAAPLIHPATGFSVAASLRLAPVAARAAVASEPRLAARALRRTIWRPQARAVHLLRRRGLEALLALPHDQVAAFFDVFFGLPVDRQVAYLSARADLAAVSAAMTQVFRHSDGDLRRHLMTSTLGRPQAGATTRVQVRRGRPEDWATARDIRLAALADAPDAFWATTADEAGKDPEFWKDRLRDPDVATFLALDQDGEGVGMLVLGRHHDDRAPATDGGVFAVWVDPSIRGSSAAADLLDAARAEAALRGLTRLRLDVGDHNTRALAFYRRAGFVPTGTRSTFPAPRTHITEQELALDLA